MFITVIFKGVIPRGTETPVIFVGRIRFDRWIWIKIFGAYKWAKI